MKRREFIAGLGGAAAWPLAARAQQAVPVVGFLNSGRRDDTYAVAGFREGLREVGFSEGQNVAIEYRWAEDRFEKLPALAAELVQRRVAVIVASPGPSSISAAKAATATLPIVFVSGPDPVRTGFVASLNRPGSNLTGVTLLSNDLTAKRLGLLHELAPQVKAIVMLLNQGTQSGTPEFQLKEAESAARQIGAQILGVWIRRETEFDAALETAMRGGAGALLVSANQLFIDHRDQVIALAARRRLPAIYQTREYASAGGLMSYGPSLSDAYRQAGAYTGRILKGERPADLPVMQPTKFELVLNLKAAKALGVTVPDRLRALADEVIE
jgi:putative ABC transport system substrate-binding protein